MITRITRILLLVQAAVAIALAMLAAKAWQIDNLLAAGACGFLAVVLVRLLIVANNFFLARLYRGQGPDELRLDWRASWRMLLAEFLASMTSSSWTMAFHVFDKRAATPAHGLPVLLIHGYGCNSGYWHAMSRALHRAGITHYAVDLEPVFGGIDDYVPIVQRAVEAMLRDSGSQKIIILAHSMGGLVARAYLRAHGSAHIAKVITLGTPHRGTGLANFGLGLNSEQMRWRGSAASGSASAWLRQLEQDESLETRALFVSIYSHHDNIVSPPASSCLEGAINIGFSGIGHVTLALDPRIQARVVEEILKIPVPSTPVPVELF
jgi:triacylglycerol esterase/lipase EstA (alpha/beta hydrolase family)